MKNSVIKIGKKAQSNGCGSGKSHQVKDKYYQRHVQFDCKPRNKIDDAKLSK